MGCAAERSCSPTLQGDLRHGRETSPIPRSCDSLLPGSHRNARGLILDRCGAGELLDELNACQAVTLVDIPFARIRNYSSVGGNESPTVLTDFVFVHLKLHLLLSSVSLCQRTVLTVQTKKERPPYPSRSVNASSIWPACFGMKPRSCNRYNVISKLVSKTAITS